MSGQQVITEHLDLWTDAVAYRKGGRGCSARIELTGIKKLRELILELAVRGKLVEQDPDDEPAAVLLDRIAEEKARLVKEGKIRKPKRPSEVTEDEKPFLLPQTWTWVRLATVGQIVGGGTPKSKEPGYWSDEGIKWLTPADLYEFQGKYINFGRRDISQAGLDSSSATLMPAGTVLFSSRAPIGYVAISGRELSTNQGFKSCVPYVDGMSEYLFYFLKSAAKEIDQAASGTTFKEISGSKMAEVLVALPPLAEQHRIVEKVDELMALCDRLEQQVGDQIEAHEVLVDTLLDALTRSADATELAKNWARVAEHFDTLFTTEASIDKLEQTILSLAVTGKLVGRNSGEESAADLLSEIFHRKLVLVKDGQAKKPKKLMALNKSQQIYPAPQHWEWASFQDVADEISTGPFGSMIHKHDYVENGTPLINPSHMINGVIKEDPSVSVASAKAEELSSYRLTTGDIVMARRGEVGRCAIVTERESGWLCGTGSFVLRFHPNINRRFILLLFSTDIVRDYLTGNSVGTTMTNLNHNILKRTPIALPPVAEQRRIVQKVDELKALCDEFRFRLREAGETQKLLADAVVEQTIN